jgi:hypothetical protein
VTWRINQVDQEVVLLDLGSDDVLEILWVAQFGVQRNSSGLDGDTTFLFIGTGIGKPRFSSFGG